MFGGVHFGEMYFAGERGLSVAPTPVVPTRPTLVVPCRTKTCANQISDLGIYNLQDALTYNGTPISILENCPTGYFCRPGLFPRVFTYPPGTFSIVLPPAGQPFPVVLSATGCESMVTRVAPANASAATIAALGNTIIGLVAQQQARCDAIQLAGPPLPLEITLSDLSNQYFCKDVASSATITASPTPTAFTLQNKPSWLSYSVSGGTLTFSGTPTAYGDYSFTVYATKPGYSSQKTYTISVVGIQNSSPLPSATNGTPYSEYLIADNIPGLTYLWTVSSGSLPPGLSINQDTWNLEGTATVDGSYDFTLTFTTELAACSKAFTMDVTAAGSFPDLEYTVLFANASALAVATVDGYNFVAGLPANGTLLGDSIVTAWTTNGNVSGYTIAYQLAATAGAGDVGNWRVNIDNLNSITPTLSYPITVEVFLNGGSIYVYDLFATTGPLYVDTALANGDILSVILAVDGGIAAPIASHQVSISVVSIP